MQIAGIAWWLLVGMFGWGAGIGLLISLWVGRRMTTPRQGEAVWWEPLLRVLAALIGAVVIPLLTGIGAVLMTFVAHRVGWTKPLPYLAGLGFVFLLLLAGWILLTAYKPPSG